MQQKIINLPTMCNNTYYTTSNEPQRDRQWRFKHVTERGRDSQLMWFLILLYKPLLAGNALTHMFEWGQPTVFYSWRHISHDWVHCIKTPLTASTQPRIRQVCVEVQGLVMMGRAFKWSYYEKELLLWLFFTESIPSKKCMKGPKTSSYPQTCINVWSK